MYKSKWLGLYCNGVPGGDLFESVFLLPTNIENETRGEEVLSAARFVTPWATSLVITNIGKILGWTPGRAPGSGD